MGTHPERVAASGLWTMGELMGRMMQLPVAMLTCCMNVLATSMASLQQEATGTVGKGWKGREAPARNERLDAPGTGFPEHRWDPWNEGGPGYGAPKGVKEEKRMSDRHCRCDCDETVKLVEYTIVSIKPCEEKVLKRGQVIYADDMSDDNFAAWVIARYFQGDDDAEVRSSRGKEESKDEREKQDERRRRREIPGDDKRYLRVYHHVLDSWARPDDCCDNRQLDVLRGIEDAIRNLRGWQHDEAQA
ncbi:MAG TPA: hypothetical protein VF173_21770 [Thermoanaerobaculia bacterium]|nr:hypothetical protein [Thermoanaerobaculia bacterium]